jgi:RNA polymerase sigma-70 factor (ECF subfamily)
MTTPKLAFQELREQLRRYIAKRLSNHEEVEDVLQDVFVRVMRNENSFQNTRSPMSWLYTVTRSVLIDHYRRQSRNQVLSWPEFKAEDQPNLPEAGFSECVLPLINKLPDKYREAVEYVDLQGGRQAALAAKPGWVFRPRSPGYGVGTRCSKIPF